MNKLIEQPFSQKPQIDINKFLENLEVGKKSAQNFRTLILQHYSSDNNNNNNLDSYYKNALDHHSMVALDSFLSSISMLQSCDFDGVVVEKRKLEDHLDDHDAISEVYANQESPKMSNSSTRRECYKKRKISVESREEVVTNLTDDGYAWRKYGQKMILKSHHPRHYYRCTHKQEQSCLATKQIQQISDNPIKYKLIYNGNHTCNNNIFKTSTYMMDTQEEHSSSIVLSFDGSNQVSPLLFPVSRSSADTCKIEVANGTPEMTDERSQKSELIISAEVAENYSPSTASSIYLDEFSTDYSCIMADFSEGLPDWWTN